MPYEELKLKHPDWNWQEAEEISEEDLEAATEYYDRLVENQAIKKEHKKSNSV